MVKALQDGYALSVTVENSGVAHAYTLRGAEYEITGNGYELTSVWLTDSDDINNSPRLFKQGVVCLYSEKNGGTGSVAFNTNMGPQLMSVVGLRVEPVSIPEPATAVLSLSGCSALSPNAADAEFVSFPPTKRHVPDTGYAVPILCRRIAPLDIFHGLQLRCFYWSD